MTGFIYLLVLVIWAVILIPMWLKNHDEVTEEKSTEKPDHTFVVAHFLNRPELTPRQRAFRRRRRTTMGLLTAFIASAFLAAAGSIPVFIVAFPAIALLGFIGMAAYYAIEASKRSRPAPAVRTHTTQVHATRSHQTEAVDVRQAQDTAARSARAWVPRETPEPSYVKAAREQVTLRNLDAQRPWTGQDMIEQAEALRATRMARLNEATERLEQARAIAMERARNAAASAERNATIAVELMNHQTNAIEVRRASGE